MVPAETFYSPASEDLVGRVEQEDRPSGETDSVAGWGSRREDSKDQDGR